MKMTMIEAILYQNNGKYSDHLFSPGQQSGSVWSNLAQMEKNNDITVRMLLSLGLFYVGQKTSSEHR